VGWDAIRTPHASYDHEPITLTTGDVSGHVLDDFFFVLKGTLDIQLRDRTVTLGPGQIYVVPKGVEHRPAAKEEVHLLLIEPSGTPNTGDSRTAAPRKTA
jgi:mannose-6-phosphate isomerase-like protein (cupin superfamily)